MSTINQLLAEHTRRHEPGTPSTYDAHAAERGVAGGPELAIVLCTEEGRLVLLHDGRTVDVVAAAAAMLGGRADEECDGLVMDVAAVLESYLLLSEGVESVHDMEQRMTMPRSAYIDLADVGGDP